MRENRGAFSRVFKLKFARSIYRSVRFITNTAALELSATAQKKYQTCGVPNQMVWIGLEYHQRQQQQKQLKQRSSYETTNTNAEWSIPNPVNG